MKFRKLVTSISLTIGSVLFVSNTAQAASFTSNVSQNSNAKEDIFLNSITQKGKTFSTFSYVESVNSFSNTAYTGGNSGAASTDKGDNATAPEQTMEDTTASNIAAFLGNNNLNNIIDGEGRTFSMDLKFDSFISEGDEENKELDSLFFWERGMNSDLTIQALDEQGNLIGNVMRLNRKVNQKYAGFKINTEEIKRAQKVGSWGVSLADLNVTGLRGVRVSADKSHSGPDFKVIARQSSAPKFAKAAKVPEPGTIIGLSSVAALAFFRRRKSK
ncbi:MAG: PEP-CTERM sorting domain-containing protein [Rivularia sp. (in: Bacteria)]|nr:PEP-CTERM sorting domain-containing protein [Rivularia sp. MS3]